MFRKILVANRGEIAMRVIRACRELGVSPVAVYSDADTAAPHALAADEALQIGAPPAAESYLLGARIIEAARLSGAEAIHPGYGFLSERAWFARAVRDAGLVFIGPTAEAIARVGSKTAARNLAANAGVSIVPGTTDAVQSAAEAAAVANEMQFPVLLKAAAGGGGKGMRVVRTEGELSTSFDAVRREAMASFGDDAIYVEKYIDRPRHIEIQLLADHHGTVLHLGERECSVQRRHQKMIEEAPSVAVDAPTRRMMGDAAVRVAAVAGYTNAGTCEFLADQNRNFYFLEMNTRIQVEHPVTEMVYGIDLVQWQIRIAAGERLPYRQDEITPRGCAIECRITSESASEGFLPSTGRVEHLSIPTGPGVRWDAGVDVGTQISPHYDPMLGKLIVWSHDRSSAIARMQRALRELAIVGVDTSREFHLCVTSDPDFVAGKVDVQWLERSLPRLLALEPDPELARAAAVVAVLLSHGRTPGVAGGSAAGPPGPSSGGLLFPRDGWPRPEWRTTDQVYGE